MPVLGGCEELFSYIVFWTTQRVAPTIRNVR